MEIGFVLRSLIGKSLSLRGLKLTAEKLKESLWKATIQSVASVIFANFYKGVF